MSHGKVAQHTLGPWHVSGDMIVNGSGNVAEVKNLDRFIQGNKKANARLIAAAPELLEACQQIIRAADDPDNGKDRDVVEQIDWGSLRAAIAKAEGRQV